MQLKNQIQFSLKPQKNEKSIKFNLEIELQSIYFDILTLVHHISTWI